MKLIKHIARVLALLTLSIFSFQLQAQEIAEQKKCDKKEEVGVICYNVLNGFTDDYEGVDRTKMFLKWIKEKDPEVVALQELTGFTQAKLEKLARKYGHPYALILKESGYAVGLTSKKPIELKKRMIEGMHHGALHARTYGIDILVIHLSPFSWEFRLKEARAISNYIMEQELDKYMVMGDFNAQSPLDADFIDTQVDLLKWMKEYEAKHTSNILHRDGAFDYSVLSTFLALPMEDPAQRFVKPELRSTNPTRIWNRNEPTVMNASRIDYILLSPSLLKDCIAAPILQDETTDYLSDHYPVGVNIMIGEKTE